MPDLGGPPQRVLDRVAPSFSISADGKRVAFVRGDSTRRVSALIIANLDGSGERELVTLPSERGFSNLGPAWSADGSMLAIGAASQTVPNQSVLLSVQVADGALRQLNPQTCDQISKVAWLHDGSAIVFHAQGPQSNYEIWLLDYPQGDLHCITSDLNRYGSGAVSVSDDGKCLLTVRAEGISSIWLGLAADLKRLGEVSKETGVFGFSWIPDGRIAYVSFLNNSYSLWMMNADGGGARQITPSGFTDISKGDQ